MCLWPLCKLISVKNARHKNFGNCFTENFCFKTDENCTENAKRLNLKIQVKQSRTQPQFRWGETKTWFFCSVDSPDDDCKTKITWATQHVEKREQKYEIAKDCSRWNKHSFEYIVQIATVKNAKSLWKYSQKSKNFKFSKLGSNVRYEFQTSLN